MAKANPLQEQMLKAGLAKKHQVAEAARAQQRQREGKAPATAQVDGRQLLAERAERDRLLAAEQKAQAHARELQAQVRQIIQAHQVAGRGEIPYRFQDGTRICTVYVDRATRDRLAAGTLVIASIDDGHALLPRAAAEMLYQRGGPVVIDHGRPAPAATAPAATPDDEYYARFVVPDDLVW